MLKRIFLIVNSLLILLSSSSSIALAANTSKPESVPAAGSSGITSEEQKMIAPDIMPPNRGAAMPFAGQNHFYSIVFRGNGESIVTLRVALTNTNENGNLNEVNLKLPQTLDLKDLSAYQIIAQGYCIRYEPRPLGINDPYYQPKCTEYSEPDYFYYYGGGKYQKAKAELNGDNLKITLPTSIASQKTGSFFVYFRTFGLAKKNVYGAYKYNFETLKVDDQINQLNIGISVDADQYLKGAKGEVGYRTTEATTALKAADAGSAPVANTTIDRFVGQIGQGQIVKTASNLASMESYKVKGQYAKSTLRLYGREIGWTFFGTLFTLALIGLLVKKLFWGNQKTNKTETKEVKDEKARNFMLSLGVSFAAALISAGYSIFLYFLTSSLNNSVNYQYQPVIAILIVVVSFAVYMLIIAGSALLVGFKKGLSWGITTFVMTVIWLIVLCGIALIVLFVLGSNGNPIPPIMPLMKGASGAGASSSVPVME